MLSERDSLPIQHHSSLKYSTQLSFSNGKSGPARGFRRRVRQTRLDKCFKLRSMFVVASSSIRCRSANKLSESYVV